MRCPDCNKFAGVQEDDPEVNSTDETFEYADGVLTLALVEAEVRIRNTSECCGAEMKEAEFNLSEEIPLEKFEGHERKELHALEVEWDDGGRTSRSTGRGRGARTFYGAEVSVTITCSCQGFSYTHTLSEDIQASHMDELC